MAELKVVVKEVDYELTNLTRSDLRVLDSALSYLADHPDVYLLGNSDSDEVKTYNSEMEDSRDNLHGIVLRMLRGD